MGSAPTMALPVNPMHAGAPMRALLTAMQAWITTGVEPPASRVPMRAHGTLVEASDAVPRGIPGLPYSAIYTGASFTDPSVLPAKVLGIYPVIVPRADRDGMAISGIRMLPLAVPRATYTSPRGRLLRGDLVSAAGSGGPVCRHARRARGVGRSASFTHRAVRGQRSLRRCGPGGRGADGCRAIAAVAGRRTRDRACDAGQVIAVALMLGFETNRLLELSR